MIFDKNGASLSKTLKIKMNYIQLPKYDIIQNLDFSMDYKLRFQELITECMQKT